MTTSLRVLGISGSLRQASYNTAALRVAQTLAPAGMKIDIADISEIPIFSEDIEKKGFPPAVERLRNQIRDADALLFVGSPGNSAFWHSTQMSIRTRA